MTGGVLVTAGPITGEDSLVAVRRALREAAAAAGLGVVDQTKLVTAGSELARNVLTHAGTGVFSVEVVQGTGGTGLRARFSDHGPGIADLDLAMADGFSTGSGLGLGLSGAKRLVHEFGIESVPGQGTTVTIAMWVR